MYNLKDRIVVKRYADAFWGYARKNIGPERCLNDLRNLRTIMRDHSEFKQFLDNLDMTYSEKCNLIDKVLSEDFSKEIRQFLKLLLEKERIDKLTDIIEYLRAAYSHEGETEVLLKTSYALDVDLIKKIEAGLEHKFKKKFRFYIDLDGSLLGGVQVIIGNTVIDGSIRRRLDELKEKLKLIRIN